MAKWEAEESQLHVNTGYLTRDGARITDKMYTPDASEIARKLNAFDEMEQVIRGITGAIAMAQAALDIRDFYSVRGLLSSMDGRAKTAIAHAEGRGIPQSYPEGSPTIEEMKGLLDRKEGRDV